jgi:hypothetical protein
MACAVSTANFAATVDALMRWVAVFGIVLYGYRTEAATSRTKVLRRVQKEMLCAAKDETSVDIMGRMFCCNFLRKSRL